MGCILESRHRGGGSGVVNLGGWVSGWVEMCKAEFTWVGEGGGGS